ncbi:MAG: hypothetical protein ACFFDH_11465 [Promethearchaeota archaeon]
MPEDNEKVEDFISLWRKKMESDIKAPSAIGDTIEKIKAIEEENEELRKKVIENVELITRTEEIVKNVIKENKELKERIEKVGKIDESNVSKIQQENIELKSKLKVLEKNLEEKDTHLKTKDKEITDLKIKLETATMTSKSIEKATKEKESEETNALIDNLKSELSMNKNQIADQEKKINSLLEENESLKQELIGKMKKEPVDYTIPVEEQKLSPTNPQSTQSSSETLELLCQDLQSDLNKYKQIVQKLTSEKSDLERTIKRRGFQLEPEELKQLKNENEDLKNELSQLQISLKNMEQDKAQINQFKELQEKFKEKEELIVELQSKQQSQADLQKASMPGLIEELQNKINNLKITIEEKNNIIEQLKSS